MISFNLPIIEVGQTTWYRVETSDFYSFNLTKYKESGDGIYHPNLITLTYEDWSTEEDLLPYFKTLLIEGLEQWIEWNVVIIRT